MKRMTEDDLDKLLAGRERKARKKCVKAKHGITEHDIEVIRAGRGWPFDGTGRKQIQSKKVVYNGVKFDSTGECNGFKRRELQEKAGEIFNLEYHPEPYRLVVNGILIATYRCDYRFHDKNAILHVQDFKPYPKTAKQKKYLQGTASWTRYRFVCKLMKAIYGIDVETVYE